MDTNTFIVEIIKSLVWPITVIVGILLLRKYLKGLFPFVSKLRYRNFELHFEKEVAQLAQSARSELPEKPEGQVFEETRERLFKIAVESPQAAMIEIWRYIENHLIEVARSHKLDVAPAVWGMPMVLAALLLDKGIISENQHHIILRIRDLRNEATHSARGEMKLSLDEVNILIDLSIRLVASLG